MVPTMILAGLAVGFSAGQSWRHTAFGVAVGCVLFGVVIALDRSSLGDGLAGFALSIPNMIVGIAVWRAGAWLAARVQASAPPSDD